MIVYAAGLTATSDNPLNTPVFGWQSVATSGTIEATSESDDGPANLLANPSTAQRWIANGNLDEECFLTVEPIDPIEMDYLAIAGHNFGSIGAGITVEYRSSESPEDWDELVADFMPADDAPLLFRWQPQVLSAIRLVIEPGGSLEVLLDQPSAAVLYAGKLLVMPRGLSGDTHEPIALARRRRILTNRSENGQYLGRYVLSQQRTTSYQFQFLDEDWYRSTMDPFVSAAGAETPFFAAWKPQEEPTDVGYCWLTSDPAPTRHRPTGTMAVTLAVGAFAV